MTGYQYRKRPIGPVAHMIKDFVYNSMWNRFIDSARPIRITRPRITGQLEGLMNRVMYHSSVVAFQKIPHK